MFSFCSISNPFSFCFVRTAKPLCFHSTLCLLSHPVRAWIHFPSQKLTFQLLLSLRTAITWPPTRFLWSVIWWSLSSDGFFVVTLFTCVIFVTVSTLYKVSIYFRAFPPLNKENQDQRVPLDIQDRGWGVKYNATFPDTVLIFRYCINEQTLLISY